MHVKPTAQQMAVTKVRHVTMTPEQVRHVQVASQDRALYVKVNHGNSGRSSCSKTAGRAAGSSETGGSEGRRAARAARSARATRSARARNRSPGESGDGDAGNQTGAAPGGETRTGRPENRTPMTPVRAGGDASDRETRTEGADGSRNASDRTARAEARTRGAGSEARAREAGDEARAREAGIEARAREAGSETCQNRDQADRETVGSPFAISTRSALKEPRLCLGSFKRAIFERGTDWGVFDASPRRRGRGRRSSKCWIRWGTSS